MKQRSTYHAALLAAVLLAISSLIVSAPAEASRVLLDRVIAVVNGEVITWSQLREAIPGERLEVIKNLPDYKAKEAERLLESRTLEMLIEEKLQVQEAEKLGLSVRDADIDAAIADIKSKNNLSDGAFEEALQREGLQLSTYRNNIKNQILKGRAVNDAVTTKVFVSDEEVNEVLKIRYPDLGGDKREAKLRLIRLDCGESRGDDETRQLAEELAEKIKEGADFGEMAGKYSDDPSRETGGDIGYVRRGTIMREIEDAAFGLEEGQVSMPIELSGSFCLVYLEKYKDQSAEVAAIREEIRKELKQLKEQEAYLGWIRELKARARIKIHKKGGE